MIGNKWAWPAKHVVQSSTTQKKVEKGKRSQKILFTNYKIFHRFTAPSVRICFHFFFFFFFVIRCLRITNFCILGGRVGFDRE